MAQTSPTLSAVTSMARVPPQAQEAEQSVLGGLLVDSRKWDEVAEAVRAEDFYTRAHREIFIAIHALHGSSQAVDVVTTSEWLKNNGTLEPAGGLALSLIHI